MSKLINASPFLRFSLQCLVFVIAGVSLTRLVIPDDNIYPALSPLSFPARLVYAHLLPPELFVDSAPLVWIPHATPRLSLFLFVYLI
ncbi:hypothetical protein FB446DRAFT_790859 [Lentinula raphanica]|nr:hypothetical protein FB446DRAFT_790859 [Lentinula raphanica]